jgi:hypothetical protein
MHFATFLRSVAAALAGLMLLSACVVVEEPRPGPWPGPGGPGPGPRPGPEYCTREYDPVCARRGDERRTFANACQAERAGFRSIRPGECRRGGGNNGGGNNGGGAFCTREYRPVCARQGRDVRTFSNACEADAAGWRVVGNGEC